MKEKELEKTRDKINTAFVAFKIGKITELEKDIVIKGYLDEYADWKIKECLEQLEISNGDGRDIEALAEKFQVPVSVMAIRLLDVKKDQILSNKDKK